MRRTCRMHTAERRTKEERALSDSVQQNQRQYRFCAKNLNAQKQITAVQFLDEQPGRR